MLNEVRNRRWIEELHEGTTDGVFISGRRRDRGVVVKSEFVSEEYKGWRLMKDHMRTLPTRINRVDGVPSLIVKYFSSRSLSEMVNGNNPDAIDSFQLFLSDMIAMWERTEVTFDKAKLVRDYAQIGHDVIPKYRDAAVKAIPEVEGKVIFVDGEVVGTLDEFFEMQRSGFRIQPPFLVLSHGDENFGNILVPYRGTPDYRLIDARFAGYYDPAWVLANLLSGTYLFNADYPDQSETAVDPILNVMNARQVLPTQTETTLEINRRVLELITTLGHKDPTVADRVCAYLANNIGRSVAYLRDKSFTAICQKHGVQHLLTAMRVSKQVSQSSSL